MLTVGLEPTTSGLEVQCAIQLRHASLFLFLLSYTWGSLLHSVTNNDITDTADVDNNITAT